MNAIRDPSKMRLGVILPCAGKGERMGMSVPKQYCRILEKPLFLIALEEFNQNPMVKKIALVVDNMNYTDSLLTESNVNRDKILLVDGAKTRHRSIWAGLQALQKDPLAIDLEVVIVHDAVRPFVSRHFITELVLAAESYGAAGATRPLVSTVLVADSDGFLKSSLNRSEHLASETPQAFKLEVLSKAYNKCSEDDLDNGTECLQLALRYANVKAKLIAGSSDLWKATYKKDIYAAISCLRERKTHVCIIGPEKTSSVRLLVDTLRDQVSKVVVKGSCTVNTQEKYNTIVIFHNDKEYNSKSLLEFPTMLDTVNLGLVIHVADKAVSDCMQNKSSCDMHTEGFELARHYKSVRKGVVVIQNFSSADDKKLTGLISSLILSDPYVFTGQTLTA